MRALFKSDTSVELGDRQSHPGRRMTERQFVKWLTPPTRAEWVDGEVVMMAADNVRHISLEDFLIVLLSSFVRKKGLGRVFGSSLQVRFANLRRRRETDIAFIAKNRLDIIKDTYIDGAPDLIVEIVSPESAARDWREKYIEYEKAGVKEYWIIDPTMKRMDVYFLQRKSYVKIEEKDKAIHSKVLPGLFIRPEWLWEYLPPDPLEILKEFGVI